MPVVEEDGKLVERLHQAADALLDVARAQIRAQIEHRPHAAVVGAAQLVEGEPRQQNAERRNDPGRAPQRQNPRPPQNLPPLLKPSRVLLAALGAL